MIKNQNENPQVIIQQIWDKIEVVESKLDLILKQSKLNDHSTEWVNSKQAALFLGVTTRTLQTKRDQGDIPFTQFGREVRFRAEDLQIFLMSHYVKPSSWKGGVL